MKVASAGADRDVEIAETANGDVEPGHAWLDHPAVEDDRGVGPALVGADPVDDRMTADLLLTVARKPQVHRQLARCGKKLGRLEEHEELTLVVGRATSVEPAVSFDELEGIRLPELERVGWLDVEVAVTENRRRCLGRARGSNLAHDERPLSPRDHLRVSARATHAKRRPIRRLRRHRPDGPGRR